jgi:hypothetical protein
MSAKSDDTVVASNHADSCATSVVCEATQLRVNLHASGTGICLGHDGKFCLALNASFDVLEIAATAAFGNMRARRNPTIGRRFKN